MEPGFILDRGHANAGQEQQWVQGEPERSFWVGIKTRGRAIFTVHSFRCGRCGYLELYANEPGE